jgi:hypothetical protein
VVDGFACARPPSGSPWAPAASHPTGATSPEDRATVLHRHRDQRQSGERACRSEAMQAARKCRLRLAGVRRCGRGVAASGVVRSRTTSSVHGDGPSGRADARGLTGEARSVSDPVSLAHLRLRVCAGGWLAGGGAARGWRKPVPVSRQGRTPAGRERRWALASTTGRPRGTKLGGSRTQGLPEGSLRCVPGSSDSSRWDGSWRWRATASPTSRRRPTRCRIPAVTGPVATPGSRTGKARPGAGSAGARVGRGDR